jgi:hypothetical protein
MLENYKTTVLIFREPKVELYKNLLKTCQANEIPIHEFAQLFKE